jgi:hypothetical protein
MARVRHFDLSVSRSNARVTSVPKLELGHDCLVSLGAPSQELISIHIHRDDDILGKRELFPVILSGA